MLQKLVLLCFKICVRSSNPIYFKTTGQGTFATWLVPLNVLQIAFLYKSVPGRKQKLSTFAQHLNKQNEVTNSEE